MQSGSSKLRYSHRLIRPVVSSIRQPIPFPLNSNICLNWPHLEYLMQRPAFFIVFGLALLCVVLFSSASDTSETERISTLEGELKVHPKYFWQYYLVLQGTGQTCGLYGSDHDRNPRILADIEPGTFIRVRGILDADHHAGGTAKNPSPFPEGWMIYMDVREVEVITADEK